MPDASLGGRERLREVVCVVCVSVSVITMCTKRSCGGTLFKVSGAVPCGVTSGSASRDMSHVVT